MGFKIVHERQICIGCGACTSVCPDFWVMDNDGKSRLLKAKKEGKNEVLVVDKVGCNQEAVDVCPVQCIKVVKA